MDAARQIFFAPFRLDPINEQLWRAEELLAVRPKPFAVLRYLVAQAGRLVSREEVRKAVWPTTYVSEGVLRSYILQLREVLGDDPEAPRFIETVPRRGYRFIAPVTTTTQPVQSLKSESLRVPSLHSAPFHPLTPSSSLVGRESELRQLYGWLTKAIDGKRQMVFITGEPGIGKTTLVDTFVSQIGEAEQQKITVHDLHPALVLVGRGQCIEHYSASEAYLPVLEALERLCRAPDGEQFMAILRQRAPTWLLQMPDLLSGAEVEEVQRRSVGTTQERMLREMAQALEELTAVQPLILWLEDLHGSDYATLDLLAFLARRREPARLLVLGTYRHLAVRTGGHPLYAIQQELQVRGQCHELVLEPLEEGAVADYLAARLSGEAVHELPLQSLAHVIHQRTEGNPLFMVATVETLLKQEALSNGAEPGALQGAIEAVRRTVPTSLQQSIEQQIAHLKPEEQRLLETASVVGVECSAAAIAAGLGERTEEVEECCAAFARRGQFVQASESEEWPDGTVATRYRFVHALYQEVLYERVTAARRVSCHRRIGERLERGYGGKAAEVAAELAMHYERGRNYTQAVQYLHLAGETALRRHAYREALAFLTKGVALLRALPETPEHRQKELTLLIALGPVLSMTRGYADREVERVYTQARELCQQLEDTPRLFPALRGLWTFSIVRAEYEMAHTLGEQLLRLAQQTHNPVLLLEAHLVLGITLFLVGDLTMAQEQLEQGISLYDPQQHYASALLYADDPGVTCLAIAAWVLWYRGYPDQALVRANEALTLARKLSHPFNLGLALFSRAVIAYHRHQQGKEALQWAEEAVALSTAQGFPYWFAWGLILQGAMLARQGQSVAEIEQMRQGLVAYQTIGAENLRPYFLALLAEAYGKAGRAEEGLIVLAEALVAVDNTGERFYEAELRRLKGELTLPSQTSLRQVPGKSKTSRDKSKSRKSKVTDPRSLPSDPQAEAEACFRQAIEIARRQGAKLLELRAVISLSRLWLQQGKEKQAQQMLTKIYGWFTEGFDTADLQEARALLEELA